MLMKSGFGEILVREVVNFDNFANFGFFPHARLGWRNADSLFSECLFRVQPRILRLVDPFGDLFARFLLRSFGFWRERDLHIMEGEFESHFH